MITLSLPSVSDALSFEQAIARLKASPRVDGLAAFGSQATWQASMTSDYDLLLLVEGVPLRVFQMVTTIDGRLADVVLVETETADALLRADARPSAKTFEALFAQKMTTAQILYDASDRLHAVQRLVTSPGWAKTPANPQSESDLYAAWFWQSFALVQLERMAPSPDPLYLSAVDMMLTSCLAGTWRSYFDIRGVAWEGEKAALRYWAEHDLNYLQTLRQCLSLSDRSERLAAYRELVQQTLEPIGKVFTHGETAVMLANPQAALSDVQKTLRFWNSLLGL